MGRRRSTKKGPDTAEEWQSESHARLSARAKERADGDSARSFANFERLATAPIDRLATDEPIAAGQAQQRRTGEQAARYLLRTSAEGQMAGGFSPNRHTVIICGRPVQVTVV